MVKKKKTNTKEEVTEPKVFEMNTEVKLLFTPIEWAIQEKLNPLLFEAWRESDPVSKKEFEKIKQQVI